MKFTKKSEQFLSAFIDQFDDFISKTAPQQEKTLDTNFRLLFDDILNARSYYNFLKHGKIPNHTLKREIFKKFQMKISDLVASTFVPSDIKKIIMNKAGDVIKFSTKLDGHNIEINFIIFERNGAFPAPILKKYDKYIENILFWFKLAFKYTTQNCSKNLKVFLYMIDIPKIMPQKTIETLSPKHCNSAVTTGCLESTDIVIFRKEEWFKVLIHESFHSLGLDFAGYSTKDFTAAMKQIYPLDGIDYTETYAEFWATIFNCCFVAFNLLEQKADFDTFMVYVQFLIKFEQIFSCFQVVKILEFMGLQYKNLYEKNIISNDARMYLFKEKTNVFGYYILKALLLWEYIDFIEWCHKTNINFIRFTKNPKTLMSFAKFIQQKHKTISFLGALQKIAEFKSQTKRTVLLQSLRMTVCELVN